VRSTPTPHLTRLCFLLTLLFALLTSAGAREILIVQMKVPMNEDGNPNVSLSHVFAQHLEMDGRVSVIVWSMGDPIFRAAVEEGHVSNPNEEPTLQQARALVSRLKLSHLLVISAERAGSLIKGQAVLYRGATNSVLWRDDKELLVTGESMEFDWENATASLSRTWTEMLGSGPFKGLPQRPRVSTPTPEAGQRPVAIEVPPVRAVENSLVMAESKKLLAEGKVFAAVLLLRQSVDDEPGEVERRLALVDALVRAGRPMMAAEEARRGVGLMPEKVELWAAGARAWIAAGRMEEAQKDLNEAIARDSNNAEVALLMAELSLARMDVDTAVERFQAAVRARPTGEGLFKLGLAHALAGNRDELNRVWGQARTVDGSLDPFDHQARYRYAFDLLHRFAGESGNQIRSLTQRARVRPKDAEVATGLAELTERLDAAVQAAELLAPPEQHVNSLARLVLALKLQAQALNDVRSFVRGGSEDLLTESAISLGDAFKHASAALDQLRNELVRKGS
jgi:tetratricopeptide (TPR) repeat protein